MSKHKGAVLGTVLFTSAILSALSNAVLLLRDAKTILPDLKWQLVPALLSVVSAGAVFYFWKVLRAERLAASQPLESSLVQ